jgi:hypothetical protein
MNFLFSPLRRGWRVATKPVRFLRRLRQINDLVTALAEQSAASHRHLVAMLTELGERQERLAAQSAQQVEQARLHQSNKLQLLAKVLANIPPLEQLRLIYPWPAVRPALAPSERGWDGGGRDLVTRRLTERSVKVILEVGTFLGLSTRTWLKAAPQATVICVDPWYEYLHNDAGIRDWPELLGKNLYHLFLSSCWDYRDRIIPLRGTSPSALQVVADLGVRPDFVYIDGEHDYESAKTDIETCHRLFPQAVLTGDDWTWDEHTHPPRAVREAVEDFAAEKGWRVEARDNTWALDR